MEVPATVLADVDWLRADLDRGARLYGRAGPRVVGTIRWYSASSVLVAAALEPLVHTGSARDPALEAVTFDMHDDGRYVDARSASVLGADIDVLGSALASSLEAAITAIAEVSTATSRSLWAIAADSVAGRLLWAASATGDVTRGITLAGQIADAVGPVLPRPRFTDVGGRPVLRRSSCCLIYEAPIGAEKCASCPRQTPSERTRRLRALLGW